MVDRIQSAFQPDDYPQLLKLSLYSKFRDIIANPRNYERLPNNKGMMSDLEPFVIPGIARENILAGKKMKLTMIIEKDTRTWEEETGITSIGNEAVRMTLILHAVEDYPQFYNGKYSFKNYMNTPFTNLFNVVAYVSFKVNEGTYVFMCTHLWNRTKMNTKPLESDYYQVEHNRQAIKTKMAHDLQLFDAEYILTQGIGLEMLCLVNKYIVEAKTDGQLDFYAQILRFKISLAYVTAPVVFVKLSKKHQFKVIDTDAATIQTNNSIIQNPQQVLDVMINFYRNRPRSREQTEITEYDKEMLKLLEKEKTTQYSTLQQFTRAVMQYVPSYVQDLNEDKNIEYFMKLNFKFDWRASDDIVMGQTAQNVILMCNDFAVKR
jgi:hypothetical protein